MKCPKCKSQKKMSSTAQAYYEGLGIIPIHLCTSCGCSVPKTMTFEAGYVYAPYIPVLKKI